MGKGYKKEYIEKVKIKFNDLSTGSKDNRINSTVNAVDKDNKKLDSSRVAKLQ